MKVAIFHPATRNVIREFPPPVRRSIGKAVWELQQGIRLGMPLSKPMPDVGSGVEELRIKDETGAYRVFFVAKLSAGIAVFHAFMKKTRSTPLAEIRLGRMRLKEMFDEQG